MNVRRRLMPVLSLLFLAAIAAGGPGAALAAEQPSLVLTASPTEITSGASTTLTVSGAPAGALVTLSRRLAGDTDFKLVGSTRADAAGTAAWTRTPPRSGVFRVESAGDDVHEAASAEVSVGVRPRIVLTAVAPKPWSRAGTSATRSRCARDIQARRCGWRAAPRTAGSPSGGSL